jgi:hypothetical protein
VSRELIVLVDMTTSYPADVRDQVVTEVGRLAVPGTRVSVGSFSAYSGSTFPKIVKQIYFERPVPKVARPSAPGMALRIVDNCLAQAAKRDGDAARGALVSLMTAARASVGKSDIMSSLQQFGAQFRSSRAPDKTGIIVSDMLENSSSTSFYVKGAVRTIDPAAELKKAQGAGVLADFARARLYVIGAGLVEGENAIRTAQQMQQLESFWARYLTASNGRLVSFGKPLLLESIE